MRSMILLCGLAAATPVLAQPAAPPKGSVTADAAEVIRAKPDQAKLVFAVAARNQDAAAATDENDTNAKQFVEGIDQLKLGGVKAVSEPLRVDRIETQNNGGGAPPLTEFHAVRAVVVTVAEADPAKLAAAVEKLQKEAAKLGVGGETGDASYNGINYERVGRVKVVYSRGDAEWEEQTAAALAKATKKATKRAEAMAAGAGLKLGELLSLGVPEDAPPPPPSYSYTSDVSGQLHPAASRETVDSYVDGELVRKVRVRVVYATTK